MIFNRELRTFLLSLGFSNPTNSFGGMRYIYQPEIDLFFRCDLDNRNLVAEMPDFQYNRVNRMSPKSMLINFDWLESDDIDVVKHNIDTFMKKALSIYHGGSRN